MEMNNGLLAMTGSGEYQPDMLPVDKYLLGRLQEPARVGLLAAAAGTEGDTYASWGQMGTEHFGERLDVETRIIDIANREDALNPERAQDIEACNFVYLSGGNPSYLSSVMIDTPALNALKSVMQSGGVVAGCSAGAMLWGRITFGDGGGLDLLPNHAVVAPHFDEFPGKVASFFGSLNHKKNPLLGIDGYTALIWGADGFHVRGRGTVTVIDGKSKRRFGDGEFLDWP